MSMTGLSKASKGYTAEDERLTVGVSCWTLIMLLWKLDVVRYTCCKTVNCSHSDTYHQQSDLVRLWYRLYLERKCL